MVWCIITCIALDSYRWKNTTVQISPSMFLLAWFMVFNATFNNIPVISWRSVFLVEETGVLEENHRPVASQWQTLSHNVVSSTPRQWTGFKLTTLVVIGTDCTRRNFGWFRTFIMPRPYYDSSHWNYFWKSSMKEVLK